MDKECIERKALLARYDAEHVGSPGRARELIATAPVADVIEVRHGRWERVIPTKSAAKWSTKVSCSNCHSVGYMRYNYCSNCGAKMDKEAKDE